MTYSPHAWMPDELNDFAHQVISNSSFNNSADLATHIEPLINAA